MEIKMSEEPLFKTPQTVCCKEGVNKRAPPLQLRMEIGNNHNRWHCGGSLNNENESEMGRFLTPYTKGNYKQCKPPEPLMQAGPPWGNPSPPHRNKVEPLGCKSFQKTLGSMCLLGWGFRHWPLVILLWPLYGWSHPSQCGLAEARMCPGNQR